MSIVREYCWDTVCRIWGVYEISLIQSTDNSHFLFVCIGYIANSFHVIFISISHERRNLNLEEPPTVSLNPLLLTVAVPVSLNSVLCPAGSALGPPFFFILLLPLRKKVIKHIFAATKIPDYLVSLHIYLIKEEFIEVFHILTPFIHFSGFRCTAYCYCFYIP